MRVAPRWLWILLLLAAPVRAADAIDAKSLDFFEKEVRPLLTRHCIKCHAAATHQRGGLVLDSKEGWRIGGDSGPALVPGQSEASLLIKAVRHQDPNLKMPPASKLSDKEIDVLVRWVSLGAPDPRTGPIVKKPGIDIKAGRSHWAFQLPRRPEIPTTNDAAWPRTDVDRFVLARLEKKKLRPVADADRLALVRRATFDLTGLPPTPAEVDAFVNDTSPEAFARLVDRLLASRHFGEHWARHWFDVARFAESSGATNDLLLVDAWRYRDYVVNAFNRDKPYDRFVIEQLAGDLLPHRSARERDEQIIATGFLALGPYDYDKADAQVRMDQIDEQIDVTSRAFLGLTVACARCHDHKYEPIPTKDYYALAGIFGSTEICKTGVYTKGKHTLVRVGLGEPLDGYDPKIVEEFTRLQEDLYEGRNPVVRMGWEWNKRLAAAKTAATEVERDRLLKEAAAFKQQMDERTAASKRAEEKLHAFPPLPPMALAVRDAASPRDQAVLVRGEIDQPGPIVPRGFVQVVRTGSVRIDPKRSGRLELARWIASRDNPLTARVAVNRVWMHLFGAGLVPSVDNFGLNGDAPSHPELLDHLAVQFMDEGWSMKKLIRSLMLSRVYQLGVAGTPEGEAIDGDNRLLWRMKRRRLEAEALRDAILDFSGQLDRTPRVQSLIAEIGVGSMRFQKEEISFASDKRSLYLPQPRNKKFEFTLLFDGVDPHVSVGQRDTTTVPPQALYMLNSPFVLEQARHAAQRLLSQKSLSERERVDLAFRLALGRPAAEADFKTAHMLLERGAAPFVADPNPAPNAGLTKAQKKKLQKATPPVRAPFADDAPQLRAWTCFCQVLIASAEFRYIH